MYSKLFWAAFSTVTARSSSTCSTPSGGSTRLYDAAEEAIKRVAPGSAESKAVVLVTDGVDTSSTYSFKDLRELAAASNVRGWLYLRRFFLPVAAPSLITGSLTGWGGGWNALIISEYLTVKGRTYSVEGIGSLLDRATYVKGDLQMITLTIVSMVVVISLINRFVWRRLYQRATERYRLEY